MGSSLYSVIRLCQGGPSATRPAGRAAQQQEQQLNRAGQRAQSCPTATLALGIEVVRVSGREITHDEHAELLLQVLAECRYRVRGR